MGRFNDYARVLSLTPINWESVANSIDKFNTPEKNSQLSSENYGAYMPRALRMTTRKFGNNVSSNKLWRIPETRAQVGHSSPRPPLPSKKL
ncbi:hypothetical protein EG68_09787 [Paragonimus skrjabini miyazakii]|uniref:Uncharacterized protein n=1 Tax=Paragonimus skrjabini miyazakii TaxID=59628 RepID=A0A8S9YQT4_9TREM|nr:hypothetical protein EG68_09787 [Paragonimus skrjabini miyazakii]